MADLPALPPAPDQGNEKVLTILCHLSLLLGVGFLLPLVVYLLKRNESPLVAGHAAEALNFHISLVIYAIISFMLIFILIGIPMLLALVVMAFVCAILAVIRASDGGFYRYPLTIRLIH